MGVDWSSLYPTSNRRSGWKALEETSHSQNGCCSLCDPCGSGGSCSRGCARAGACTSNSNHYEKYPHNDGCDDSEFHVHIYVHVHKLHENGDINNIQCDNNPDINDLQSDDDRDEYDDVHDDVSHDLHVDCCFDKDGRHDHGAFYGLVDDDGRRNCDGFDYERDVD